MEAGRFLVRCFLFRTRSGHQGCLYMSETSESFELGLRNTFCGLGSEVFPARSSCGLIRIGGFANGGGSMLEEIEMRR